MVLAVSAFFIEPVYQFKLLGIDISHGRKEIDAISHKAASRFNFLRILKKIWS